jgi:ribosomal protein S18 acetylase RimI-like enzyme
MGVDPTCHRKGLGRSLMKLAIQDVRKRGIKYLFVATLYPDVEYEPILRTCLLRGHGLRIRARRVLPGRYREPHRLLSQAALVTSDLLRLLTAVIGTNLPQSVDLTTGPPRKETYPPR